MIPKLTAAAAPVQPAERITAIDTLRGIALLGMIIVHFSYNALRDKTGINAVVSRGIDLFADGRFYTMFAILFGVGFAMQLERAKSKGIPFVPPYLRRLLALLSFGVITELFFGFHILLEYSLCALLLLLVRNWSTKALVTLTLVIALLGSIYTLAYNSVSAAVNGVEKTKTMNQERNKKAIAYWTKKHQIDSLASNTPGYSTAVALRTKGMVHRYSSFWPVMIIWLGGPFLFFLIGLLTVRTGIFKDPKRHMWLIIGFMIFGIVSWALSFRQEPLFTLPSGFKYPAVPYALDKFLEDLSYGFYILSSDWLTFTYMGVVLLVATYFKKVQRRFFSSAGRMALTNYMVQTVVLSLLFVKSGFGFGKFPAAMGPVYALLLFSAMVLFSRWWLPRYHYGPLEWLWRSVTYWKIQPLRKGHAPETGRDEGQALQEPVPVPVINNP